jgi:mono/diheme cytochrome c family protein
MGRFLAAMAMLLAVCAGSSFGQTDGRNLYIAECSSCHARDGSGNGTIGRSLNLGDIRPAIKSMTDEQLRQLILQGQGTMPANKKFDDEKIGSLTLFLRDLAAGNPDTGRAVAQAKAQPLLDVDKVYQAKCSACHALDGTGRTTIGKSLSVPDLTSAAVQGRSVEELAQIITNGKGRMPAYAKRFNPAQVAQLVSYVHVFPQGAKVKEPVAIPKASASTPQPPPSVPAPAMPHAEAVSPTPRAAGSTAPQKLPEAEVAKTAEPKPATAPVVTNRPRSGGQIYISKCSACHSKDGSGTGTIGKSMQILSLTSPQVQAQSDDDLARAITNGTGKMPAYKKKYSPAEIQLLVAYVRELGNKH